MVLRAWKFRTPLHPVVDFGAFRRSSNEKVDGSDLSNQ